MPSGPVFVEAIFALRNPDYAQHVCTTRVSRGRFFARMEITPEMLRNIFDYNPNTGVLRRRKNGKIAGYKTRNGVMRVFVLCKSFSVHRIAFAIANNRWPTLEVDHINGNPSDNRIANLREVSHKDNMRNIGVHRDSRTGILGVSLCKRLGKYQALISNGSKQIHLGYFIDKEDAAAARRAAELKYHGKFAPHISRVRRFSSPSQMELVFT